MDQAFEETERTQRRQAQNAGRIFNPSSLPWGSLKSLSASKDGLKIRPAFRFAPLLAAILFAAQGFAQDEPPDRTRIRVINRADVIEGAPVPSSTTTNTPAPAPPKTDEEKRLAELLKLKFDRSPASILKAQVTLAVNLPPEDKVAERFQQHVIAGRWNEVGAFLKTLPEKSATQLYESMLKDLDRVTTNTPQPGQQAAGPTASTTLLQDDIVALADLAPAEPTGEQLKLLAALLKRVISVNPALDPLLARLDTGSVHLGGKDVHKREQAAELLIESGRPLDAKKFLPPLEAGHETDSLPRLDRYVKCTFDAARANKNDAAEMQRAWDLNLAIILAPKCPADLSERAWRRCADIARFLPPAVGSAALRNLLLANPLRAQKVLRSVGTQVGVDRTSRNLSLRQVNLELQRNVAGALLPLAERREQLQPAMNLFALNWLEEAAYAKQLYQPPRRQEQFDEFGNRMYFGGETSSPSFSSNPNQLPPLPLADVLPSAPDAAWLAALDAGLLPRMLTLLAEIHLKLEDDTKALPFVEQLAPLDGKDALRLANDLLRTWATTHDPQRNVPRRRPGMVYYSGMMMQQPQGIPLTRALQQRNLEELSALLARLRKLPLKPLDDSAIVKAFTMAHSQAEVFREESIELVLGKDVKPETLAELLQTMRERLATQWRKPSVQQQAKTQRTDAQIDSEVLRGYELLGSLLEKGLARQPDDWRLNLAQAATWFDWAEFQYGKKVDLAIYVEKRERSFAAFDKAAKLYAAKLPTLGEKEETPVIFQQWLNANLGASDLAMVTRQQESNAKSLQRIREAILTLPGAAAERHFAALAKAVTSSAESLPANLKRSYLRAALAIVGERPEAEEIRKLVTYHDGLLREIETSVRIDGDASVGHGQPFGVFLTVRHTAELERENQGGFSKWLRNQSQNPYFYSPYGIAPVDHREELEKQMREKLGEGFEIVSIVFHDDKVQSRGYGRPGWRETPLVYLLLKAKDASVDHLPSLRLDVDFIDAKGPVVLPVESAVQLLDARADRLPARPMMDLEIVQTLDDRALREGKLTVEVKATAKGLVPKFEELFDFAPAGLKIETIDDGGPAVQRLASEGDALTAVSERNWLIKLQADPAAGRALAFQFPKPKSTELKVAYKRYQDADVVEATPELTLTGGPVNFVRLWSWIVAALVALGALVWWLRRNRKLAASAHPPSAYALPTTITPFSILQLLRQMHADANLPLSEAHRTELADAVAGIEDFHFSPHRNGAKAPDLDALGRDWVDRARGAGS